MTLQDYTGYTVSLPASGCKSHFIIKSIVDCSKSVANGGFGTMTSTDTAKVIDFHEGWLVERVYLRLIALGTLGATVMTQLGDSTLGDAWVATNMNIGTSGTINQVKGCVHLSDTDAVANGYLYLTDNYLLLAISTADFDGTIEFAAEVIDVFGGDTIV